MYELSYIKDGIRISKNIFNAFLQKKYSYIESTSFKMIFMNSKRKHIKTKAIKAACFIALIFGMTSCNEESTNTNGHEIEVDLDDTTYYDDESILDEESLSSEYGDFEVPDGYSILAEENSDLDGDGIDEKVVIFDTDRAGEMGTEREVHVYALYEDHWSLWESFIGPVLASEHGGMMGDPFEKLEVHDQRIYINHFGGSSSKWHFTHEFEFKNDNWTVAAATLVYFQNCVYSETYTYDFNERTCFYSKQLETCNEDGMVLDRTMEDSELIDMDSSTPAPEMKDFSPGGTLIDLKGEKEIYYL